MKTVAILLARGGSKGILRKNLVDLCGKPLISYGIEAAVMAGLETWVSTDDEEIATVSKQYGAKVLMRPPELAEDTSSSEEALLHFAENVEFDRMVFIQPTSPLIKSLHIEEGLKMMEEYDSIFSAYKYHWEPMWYRGQEGTCNWITMGWDTADRPRRQDMSVNEAYVENGAFYITSKDRLIETKLRYSGMIEPYIMERSESIQVDSWDDLRIIEAILGQYK